MTKFVDINSLTEKVNPDGNEQIQVSDTQKFVWKNALMNSGESIGAILSYATQYAMGNDYRQTNHHFNAGAAVLQYRFQSR